MVIIWVVICEHWCEKDIRWRGRARKCLHDSAKEPWYVDENTLVFCMKHQGVLDKLCL